MGCCGCCCSEESDEKISPKKLGNPIKNRTCTDVFFLLIFVLFWIGMIYIAAFSIVHGDGIRLVFGYDSFGNTCNRENSKISNVNQSGVDTTDMTNLFYLDYKNPFNSMQLCVKECPSSKLMTKQDVQQFSMTTGSKLCRYDINISDYLSQNFGTEGPCPALPVFKSFNKSLLNRCVPDLKVFLDSDEEEKNATKSIFDAINADDIFRKVLSDLYSGWRQMLALCGISVVIAFLCVILIRYLASVIVWFVCIIAVVGSLAGTGFLWWTYAETKNKLDEDRTTKVPILNVDVSNEQAFLIMAIVATVLTLILLLLILVMRKRLALVVALFHEAGKCLAKMPLLLIQPLWTFLVLMAFFAYWVVVLSYISTAGKPTIDTSKGFEGVKFEELGPIRYFWWYHLVGLIWTAEFILASQQMVIAGAVATWYFTRQKSELSNPIGKSTCRLILHHLGSVAFGSFIITLVKLPRLILMYIEQKTKGSENIVAKFCLKCCICCLWCLEKLLKFLNQNAYTVIAIDGRHFCSAAKKALKILVNNVLRVAAINSVGAFVLFLGKVGVMSATAAIGIIWFKNLPFLHYFAVPVILVCLFAFLIAHCFFSIYEMTIDTLLLCFCIDNDENDGSPGHEYFMSKSLMELVNKTNKR